MNTPEDPLAVAQIDGSQIWVETVPPSSDEGCPTHIIAPMDQIIILGGGKGRRMFGQEGGQKHLLRPTGSKTILHFLLDEVQFLAPANILVQIHTDDERTEAELEAIGSNASILRGDYLSSSSAVSAALAVVSGQTDDLVVTLPGDIYGREGRLRHFLTQACSTLAQSSRGDSHGMLALAYPRPTDQRPIYVTKETNGVISELHKGGNPRALVSLGARVTNLPFVRDYLCVAPGCSSDYEVLNHLADQSDCIKGIEVQGLQDIDDPVDLQSAPSL